MSSASSSYLSITGSTTVFSQTNSTTTLSAHTSSSSTLTSSKSQTSLPATNNTSPSTLNRSSLSTGVKAGIGVGVALGTLMIILLFAWVTVATRKLRKLNGPQEVDAAQSTALVEAMSAPKYELPDEDRPPETSEIR
jgi:hypothetical protein